MWIPLYVRRDRWALFCASLLPNWLVYWAAIRLIGYATEGKYASTVVPELTALEALKRWAEGKCKS
jgi:hypothetical protein